MDGSLRALATVKGTKGNASHRLHLLLVLHITSILENSYGAVLLTDLEHLEPKQRAHYVKMRDTFERGIRDLIREGIENGEFPKRSVAVAGFAILGGINWIMKWFDPNGAESSATIAQTFADLYVGGLMRPAQIV